MNGKYPICTFSTEKGYDYYEFSMAAPVFYCCMVKVLEWERLRKMGTVAGTVAKKLHEKTLDCQRISS